MVSIGSQVYSFAQNLTTGLSFWTQKIAVPMDKYSSNNLAGNFNVYHLHYPSFAASFEDSVGKISSEVSMLWIQP